ncbi:MAG: CPBP family intramembrane metalloprotease [Oscillospiraceae bacterium]|nr:CPBP family intramembrane metalloprotease [Oscillospiraceae bacterium]
MKKIRSVWQRWFGFMLRYCRRFSDFLPLASVLSFVLAVTGTLLSTFILKLPVFENMFDAVSKGDDNVRTFLWDYAAFIGIWVVILLVMCRKPNRPMFRLLVPKKNTLKHIALGVLLGFGSNSFCVLMSALMGDIKLYYAGVDDPWPLIAFIVFIFIQSGAEELMDRMYLYSKLRRRYSWPAVAILANSLVFALMHLGNDGFTLIAGTQIFLVGLLFSLFMYWYDGLWIAMTYHAAWNFCQSVFFGLPNSGIVSSYSVFKLDAASAENGFFYNVDFGVEGSVGAVLLFVIEITVIILLNREKQEKNDIWRQMDEQYEKNENISAEVLNENI